MRISRLCLIASLIAIGFAPQTVAAQDKNAGHSAPSAKPLDPDEAPIAAVDRFSAKAAHLQLRTADNDLPGPNEPVDFDREPFITQGLSPSTGKPVRYYNLDVQSTTPAPVYVLYREGEEKPVVGQLDIIDSLPGEVGYNDFRQVWKVLVPKTYVANSIADAATLREAGFKTEATDVLRNMPVVPDRSRARARLKSESAKLESAWYRGEVAKYFSFEEATQSAAGSSVPLSPIYVTFNVNPDQANGGPGRDSAPRPGLTKRTTFRRRCRGMPGIRRCGWCRSTTMPIFPRSGTSKPSARLRFLRPAWRPSIG